MKRVSKVLVIIIAFLSSGFVDKDIWIIDHKSQLTIHGSTNVTNFTCRMDCYSGSDTLEFVRDYVACELQFSRNRMTIPVRSFDCGARQISNDFWKTLKSEKYPQLDINFRSLQNLDVKENSSINGVVDITLAGVTARYTIRYQVTQYKNTILLKGIHPVYFSDFNLEAPEKLQGLIKVNECLNVEFNLVLKEV
jgi:hypothetical protein